MSTARNFAVATTPHRPRAATLSARIAGATATSTEVAGGRGKLVTTAQLEALIRPFVGAKINRQRDPASPYGAYLPRTAAIDIHHTCDRRDADIRAIGPDGVEDFFYQGCDPIPWHAIRSVTIAALDEHGDRVAETTYRHCVVRSVA